MVLYLAAWGHSPVGRVPIPQHHSYFALDWPTGLNLGDNVSRSRDTSCVGASTQEIACSFKGYNIQADIQADKLAMLLFCCWWETWPMRCRDGLFR